MAIASSFGIPRLAATQIHNNQAMCLPYNAGDPLTKARASMTYFLRDVIYQWSFVPDKAKYRAAHHSHHTGGDPWAFRLLKPMRGELLTIENPALDVWATAAAHENRTTVLLFNDRREDATISVELPSDAKAAKVATIIEQDGAIDPRRKFRCRSQIIPSK